MSDNPTRLLSTLLLLQNMTIQLNDDTICDLIKWASRYKKLVIMNEGVKMVDKTTSYVNAFIILLEFYRDNFVSILATKSEFTLFINRIDDTRVFDWTQESMKSLMAEIDTVLLIIDKYNNIVCVSEDEIQAANVFRVNVNKYIDVCRVRKANDGQFIEKKRDLVNVLTEYKPVGDVSKHITDCLNVLRGDSCQEKYDGLDSVYCNLSLNNMHEYKIRQQIERFHELNNNHARDRGIIDDTYSVMLSCLPVYKRIITSIKQIRQIMPVTKPIVDKLIYNLTKCEQVKTDVTKLNLVDKQSISELLVSVYNNLYESSLKLIYHIE